MIPSYPNQLPPQRGFQSTSNHVGGMIASIVLDQTHNTFTNLDVISGRVILRLESSTNVNSVVIKLEGESMTRLKPPPTGSDDNPKPVREVHKVCFLNFFLLPPEQCLWSHMTTLTRRLQDESARG